MILELTEVSWWTIKWQNLLGKHLYLKLRMTGMPEDKTTYEMWFRVLTKDGRMFVIFNPNHYDTTGDRKEASLFANDEHILEYQWLKLADGDKLLAAPKEHEEFMKEAKAQDYYPTKFIIHYGPITLRIPKYLLEEAKKTT